MLTQYDFLSAEECKRTLDIVLALKEFWVNRGSGFLPFYTLGAASYLDASSQSQEAYIQAAERFNPVLASHFPSLYERLTEKLSEILKMPVRYAEEMALPGFHIFLSSKAFEYPVASSHFDIQHEKLLWKYDQVDTEHLISFTCPIAMPTFGSGLNYWNIMREEAKELSAKELERFKKSKEMFYLPYKLGSLILHQTIFLHQIAPSKNLLEEDERITLQGHGIIGDGIMRLYW
jgi:hypothetical protein